MEKVYYYKTASDTWHFSTGVVKDALRGSQYKRMLEYAGRKVEKLYLNVPDHFDKIKTLFHSRSYWDGRTWMDEYEERNHH